MIAEADPEGDARARDDARWQARRRLRQAITVLAGTAPPPVAALVGDAQWRSLPAPLLIALVVGLVAVAGGWSIPRAALTLTALWLALGSLAARIPLLADGIAALLAAHLLAVAAVAASVLIAAWGASEE